jgi:IS5 family transposase
MSHTKYPLLLSFTTLLPVKFLVVGRVFSFIQKTCFILIFVDTFNLSDPGAEDALYESTVLRRFAGEDAVDEVERRKNRTKARVRSKVEWPFRILKRVFGYTKVRYRGLKKNHEWLLAAFALVNLYQHRKRLSPLGA